MTIVIEGLAEEVEDTLSDDRRTIRSTRVLLNQHGELVATEAGHQIFGPCACSQAAADLNQ
jgi:hypothetical protein